MNLDICAVCDKKLSSEDEKAALCSICNKLYIPDDICFSCASKHSTECMCGKCQDLEIKILNKNFDICIWCEKKLSPRNRTYNMCENCDDLYIASELCRKCFSFCKNFDQDMCIPCQKGKRYYKRFSR